MKTTRTMTKSPVALAKESLRAAKSGLAIADLLCTICLISLRYSISAARG
jgi:hypothetical protein